MLIFKMDESEEARVLAITKDYGELHQAILQLLLQVKSIDSHKLTRFVGDAVADIVIDEKTIKRRQESGNDDRNEAETERNENKTDDDVEEQNEQRQNSRENRQLRIQVRKRLDDIEVLNTMGVLNRRLTPLNLCIERMIDENSTDDVESSTDEAAYIYTLINRKSTKVLQISTSFSEKEMKVISFLLDLTFGDSTGDEDTSSRREHYSIARYDTLNNIRSGFGYSMVEAEQLMTRLVLDGWFELFDTSYSLTPRSLLELKDYLKERYPSVSTCLACGQILVRGLECKVADCPVRFHSKCYQFYKVAHQNDVSCPGKDCTGSLEDVVDFS